MRQRIVIVACAALLTAGLPAIGLAGTFQVDPAHTSVTFRVRHLFTSVTGRFDRFEGKIDFDPARPEATKVQGSIEAASINTNNAKRDDHLRSKDFFHVEQYPKLSFASTNVTDLDAEKKSGRLHGDLTIHGVTKPVVLDVSYLGTATDPWGNKKAGFSARTAINRKDFGLAWNQTLEAGGVLVGEEVEIDIAVEGNVQE